MTIQERISELQAAAVRRGEEKGGPCLSEAARWARIAETTPGMVIMSLPCDAIDCTSDIK